jgi:crossover junction endodeoxyribonuclease RuvC
MKKLKSNFKILALDIATTTGYAIYNGKDFIHGIIKSPKEKQFYNLRVEVESLINKHQPNIILIEDTFIGPYANAAKKLNMFRGAVIQLLEGLNINFQSVNNTTIKSVLVKNNHAKKDQVVDEINKLFNLTLDPKQNDEADSMALAYIFYKELSDGN